MYNVPCDATPSASHNPWRVLAAVVTKDDYVVVKVDIDHQRTELALIDQLELLGPRRRLARVGTRGTGMDAHAPLLKGNPADDFLLVFCFCWRKKVCWKN